MEPVLSLSEVQNKILDVKDFPKEGIVFKDITPLFEDALAFKSLIHHLSEKIPQTTTKLLAIESRGFILASALAYKNNLPFCLARKPGKLPREVLKERYDLEYGQDELQVHKTSILPNDHVLIIDDILASGGTAQAAEKLCQKFDCQKIDFLFLLELSFLNGSKHLENSHQSLIAL